MKRLTVIASVIVLALGAVGGVAAASGAMHHGNSERGAFGARLGGFQEVPSVLTAGSGSVRLTLDAAGTTLAYTLWYAGLGGGSVSAADLQFAQSGVKGGLVAYLCGGGKPACRASPATVTGTIVAADILGPAAQGLAAGDLQAALRATGAGAVFANVMTASFGSGEVRGQIHRSG